jgi:hypothetical protein
MQPRGCGVCLSSHVAFQRRSLGLEARKLHMATSHGHPAIGATLEWHNSPLPGPACGQQISLPVEHLHLHPAVENFGRLQLDEIPYKQDMGILQEPILLTPGRTILGGFERWLGAKSSGARTVPCIEHPIDEDKALEFILRSQCRRMAWNPFVRIRMALSYESNFRQQALENMRIGGKYKGSADLPNPAHIDVRKQVARLADVGDRSVGNVKTIISKAHPRVLQMLERGTLQINCALQLCQWPADEQLGQLISMRMIREINKHVSQGTADGLKGSSTRSVEDVLETLLRRNVQRPGSVQIRIVDLEQTIILVSRDLLSKTDVQEIRTA